MKRILKKILTQRIINHVWHKPKSAFVTLFFGFPAKKLVCIAVAGTKGKTSTTYYMSQILDCAGMKHVLFTTAIQKIAGEESLNTLKLTSPTAYALNALLVQGLKKGCTHAILEVSSHALDQYRLWGVPFSWVCVTNLTPDHLEYHATTQEYRDIHARLVSKTTRGIMCGDEQECAFLMRLLTKNEYHVAPPELLQSAIAALPSSFLYHPRNLQCAVSLAHALGLSSDIITRACATLTNPPGRFEMIESGKPYRIVVDYAHSPESLAGFFHIITQQKKNRLVVVFGGCGDRDKNARPVMGELLDRYADIIILTNDDPYSENPSSIAAQVAQGIKNKIQNQSLFTILERRDAISHVLSIAQTEDIVCVLGKGAEQWQIIGTRKIPWDDRRVVRELLHAQT